MGFAPIWDPHPGTRGRTGLEGQSDTGRHGSKSLPVLVVAGDPAGRRKEKGLSPKLRQAEHGFLAGKPKIVSLLRRGCRRDLIRSAAKYLGGCRTDPEQHGFTEASPDLGKAATIAEPANNPVISGHLIMLKAPEEPGWLLRGHLTPAELGSSHRLPLVCGRGSARGMEMAAGQGIFPVFHGLAQGISGTLPGRLCCPCSADPSQAMPSSAGLLLPALGNSQLLLGKLAKRRQTRKALPLPGECPGQLLTQQHLCAVLTYHLSVAGGLAPSPSTSVGSYSWKHPGVTFNHAFTR